VMSIKLLSDEMMEDLRTFAELKDDSAFSEAEISSIKKLTTRPYYKKNCLVNNAEIARSIGLLSERSPSMRRLRTELRRQALKNLFKLPRQMETLLAKRGDA
jgi:hypothetical protein